MTGLRETMRIARKFTVAALVALGCAGACDGVGGTDSNTNWLEPCGDDGNCGSLQCLCGRCSKPCTYASDCSGLNDAICGPDGPQCGCSLPSDAGTSSGGSAGAGGASAGGDASAGGTSAGGDASAGGASAGGDASAGGAGGTDASTGGAPETDSGVDAGDGGSTIPAGPNPLDFSFPTAHSMTDADGMRVSGIIDAVTDVVSVSVNGIPAESLDGAFSRWRTTADVPLAPGKNTLRVIATRSAGPALTLSGTVWRKPASTVGQLVPANLISFATVMSLFQQLQATGIAWDRTSRSWLISYEGQGSGLVAIDDSGAWIEPPAATPPPPLRACTGAMVDPASRPCRVAEGTFDGGAIVLVQLPDAGGDVASTERWQVRFFEPATETLSTWFDITVSGTLTSAAVDADGARLAVGIAGPFALEVYDLPGGAGPGSLMFGSGPMTDLFRAEAYDTAVMQDGHLLVQRGLFSVDPSTGIRRPVSPPTLGGFGPARLYPDPLTGEFIAVTAGGTFRLARDFSSSTRLGDSLGGVPASDFANRKMYAVGDGVINVLDVGTGALQSIPAASDSLQSVVACMVGLASASSHQGVLYLEAFANVPGPPPINSTCGCFKYDLVSGEVDPFVCTPQETRDGRLLSAGAGVSIVDPETGTETPFSRAPDHGRGFPIPVGIRSSLAVDPRRDRIWVSNVNSDISPEPQRYFVIDPFNGDRALVSD